MSEASQSAETQKKSPTLESMQNQLEELLEGMFSLVNQNNNIVNQNNNIQVAIQNLTERVENLEHRQQLEATPPSPISEDSQNNNSAQVAPMPILPTADPSMINTEDVQVPTTPLLGQAASTLTPPATSTMTPPGAATRMPTAVSARAAAVTVRQPKPTPGQLDGDSTEEEDCADLDFSMMYPGYNADVKFEVVNPALSQPKKEPPKERKSFFMRQQDRALKAAQDVHYTQPVPDSSHIKLEKLSPWRVLTFWSDMLEYHTVYGVRVNIAARIHRDVREQIISRNYATLRADKFYTLTYDELQMYTIKMIQPTTRGEFLDKMEKCVRFPRATVLKPSAEYFHLFYSALLLYRSVFERMYEFLSRDNDTAVPECTIHKGGILRCFLTPIPHQYGLNLYINMSVKKFDGVMSFLVAFYAVVETHYAWHKNTTHLNACFLGTAAAVFDAKRSAPELSNIVEHDYQVTMEEPDDDSDYPDQAHLVDSDDTDEADYGEETLKFEAKIANMVSAASGGKGPLACFTKLLHGQCNKAGCKYAHDKELCDRTRTTFMDMMRKVQQPSAQGPRAQSTPFTARKQPYAKPKLSALEEEDDF